MITERWHKSLKVLGYLGNQIPYIKRASPRLLPQCHGGVYRRLELQQDISCQTRVRNAPGHITVALDAIVRFERAVDAVKSRRVHKRGPVSGPEVDEKIRYQ